MLGERSASTSLLDVENGISDLLAVAIYNALFIK